MENNGTSEEGQQPLHVIELRASNVKRLKAVTIRPSGNVVVIGGRNGQGKSSVLDSIMFALAGKECIPDKPIRAGQKSASVSVDLGEFTVTRTFTAAGGSLIVKGKDDKPQLSPQTFLDKIVGDMSFDPLAFCNMKPPKQIETLKSVLGLDFTEIDQKRVKLFEDRAEANRQVKTLEARLKTMQHFETIPKTRESADVLKEISGAQEKQQKRYDLESSLTGCQRGVDGLTQTIANQQEKIAEIEKQLAEALRLLGSLEVELATANKSLDAARQAVEKAEPAPDVSALTNELSEVNEAARRRSLNEAYDQAKKELRKHSDKSEKLTQSISDIDSEKETTIAAAKFPVKGMAFGETGLLFNGIPFDQASAAEKLRVSTAMAMAINPKVRVFLIRDGSLLDSDNMALLAELARENNAQVWLECVGKDEKTSIVIEDGMIDEPVESAEVLADAV